MSLTLPPPEIQMQMLAREIVIAETVARLAHYDQKIKSTGERFIMHPKAVAQALPPRYQPAGWLHDVLEDTPLTDHHLMHFGISADTIRTVLLVSRLDPMKETYKEFIQRIATSHHEGAILVKLADLQHNLRPGCPRDLEHRYRLAIPILEAALAHL